MLKMGDVVIIDRFDGSFNIGVITDIIRHGNPNLIGSQITYSYAIEDKSQKLIEIDVDRAYSKVRLATKEEIEKEYSDYLSLYKERDKFKKKCYFDRLYKCIEKKLELNKESKFTKKYNDAFNDLMNAELELQEYEHQILKRLN